MDIKVGATVKAKDGTPLGTVDHVMRNTVTGEISKFVVNRKPPESDLFFTPENILQVENNSIAVDIESGG